MLTPVRSVPSGTFISCNVMTPEWLAYYKLSDNSYAELSRGTGISGRVIYGVTVRPDPLKRSKCFFNMKEAMDYIEDMS